MSNRTACLAGYADEILIAAAVAVVAGAQPWRRRECCVSTDHFDVLIIVAGISGIGSGDYLQERCPSRRYVILEGRGDLGGTWGLFRYPGVRSDSDLFTLGYSFRPWKESRAIADGPAILNYLRETAREFGIDRLIRFRQRVRAASLRAELSAEYVCRLLRYVGRRGYAHCVPRCDPDTVQARPLLPLTSGYVRRGSDRIPKQGSEAPWVMHQNYVRDLISLRWAGLDDGVLEFARAGTPVSAGTSSARQREG